MRRSRTRRFRPRPVPPMRGSHSLYRIDAATGRWDPRPLVTVRNAWMYTYGYILARGLAQLPGAGLNYVYFEYENVADPADAVSVPSFTRGDRRDYYEDLASSPTRDYLRVPVENAPSITVAAGDEAFFGPGEGNVLTLFAQTGGTTGMTGKAFGPAANSKICGVALVAAPVAADRTQDLLFARSYYPVEKQQVVTVGTQFGMAYPLTFQPPPSE